MYRRRLYRDRLYRRGLYHNVLFVYACRRRLHDRAIRGGGGIDMPRTDRLPCFTQHRCVVGGNPVCLTVA